MNLTKSNILSKITVQKVLRLTFYFFFFFKLAPTYLSIYCNLVLYFINFQKKKKKKKKRKKEKKKK